MRLVYFYRGVPVGTPLMHIRFIITALRRQGHEVIECFPASRSRSLASIEKDARTKAKAWYRAWMPRPLVNAAQIYEARRARWPVVNLCRHQRPDFIYERYSIFTDAGLLAAKEVGCPLIQEVNAVYSLQYPEVFASGFRGLARRSDAALLPRADALVAVSEEVARALRKLGVPADKITVMHNAVDPVEYEGLQQERERRRASLGLDGAFVIVVLQALEAGPFPRALLGALTTAWPIVHANVPRARLLWIGGGTRLRWFQQRLLSRLPGAKHDILFLGKRPHAEVLGLLACGDLGLVPWHLPFCSPMKIFEYAAAGLPVVAPDLPGIREVVRDRETGVLFPHEDFTAMAEAIAQLIADPEWGRGLAAANREYVPREHTWDRNAARVVEIARSLIGVGG